MSPTDLSSKGHKIDYWEDTGGERFTNETCPKKGCVIGYCAECGMYFEFYMEYMYIAESLYHGWRLYLESSPDCKDLLIKSIIQ